MVLLEHGSSALRIVSQCATCMACLPDAAVEDRCTAISFTYCNRIDKSPIDKFAAYVIKFHCMSVSCRKQDHSPQIRDTENSKSGMFAI